MSEPAYIECKSCGHRREVQTNGDVSLTVRELRVLLTTALGNEGWLVGVHEGRMTSFFGGPGYLPYPTEDAAASNALRGRWSSKAIVFVWPGKRVRSGGGYGLQPVID